MIYGIGYDLCKIERMKKSLQSETFCKRVFGSAEWAALQALGYTASEAAGAVARVKDQANHPDELVRLALKNMAGM